GGGLGKVGVGELEGGWEEYEWRRQRKGFILVFPEIPHWDGQRRPDKTLLIVAEQGLGDTLQFCRYLPMVKERHGGRILFLCQKPLVPLVKLADLGIDEVIPWGERPPAFDQQMALVSLPRIFGTRLDGVPAGAPYLP